MRNKETHIFFKIRAFFKIHVPFFIYLTYGKFFLINIFKELLCKKMKTRYNKTHSMKLGFAMN
ncbi:hypothetical protein HPHPH19_1365 [Helicobacter pylori Hp H-19]|nr:hypothetical protein HPHPH19_1365 [Helicobacter pylori Hp H-19]MUU20884.1 hypothetical protein [Helicobacter pylori]MUU47019.1 hypothetical protein [Helicobacter pylori]NHA20571.1 hypothetical protein [Helicobacter pylori]OPG22093.1 hypothetical protein BGL57_05540 [Helicobacter pylori]